MKKLVIACSPLTSTIFGGFPTKPGVWGKDKYDVTDQCVYATAQNLLETKTILRFTYQEKEYILQVVENLKG